MDPKYQSGEDSYPHLPLESLKSVVEQAIPLGLLGVKLTGGEPLLHPQIREILEFICIKNIRLIVETNGILCTHEAAKAIFLCRDAFVSVSLDSPESGAHDYIRGVKDSFDRAKDGISNLVKAGLKPQIIMTVMRRNKNRMEEMSYLAESLGAGSVKFNIVQPTARGKKMHEEGEALSIKELIELGNLAENRLSKKARIPVYYSHPPAFRPLGKMFADKKNTYGICGILGIIGVIADGSYALCGIGETVRELVFGDAVKDRLEDVWNDNPILRQLREGLPGRLRGICGECVMKHLCRGSCIAQNYYLNRDLWAPFWYCSGARSEGLFPESRICPAALTLQYTKIDKKGMISWKKKIKK